MRKVHVRGGCKWDRKIATPQRATPQRVTPQRVTPRLGMPGFCAMDGVQCRRSRVRAAIRAMRWSISARRSGRTRQPRVSRASSSDSRKACGRVRRSSARTTRMFHPAERICARRRVSCSRSAGSVWCRRPSYSIPMRWSRYPRSSRNVPFAHRRQIWRSGAGSPASRIRSRARHPSRTALPRLSALQVDHALT